MHHATLNLASCVPNPNADPNQVRQPTEERVLRETPEVLLPLAADT